MDNKLNKSKSFSMSVDALFYFFIILIILIGWGLLTVHTKNIELDLKYAKIESGIQSKLVEINERLKQGESNDLKIEAIKEKLWQDIIT